MKIDLEVGDEILVGKWKNKKVIVKTFGFDEKGQPTVNGKPALKFRIAKLVPRKENMKLEKMVRRIGTAVDILSEIESHMYFDVTFDSDMVAQNAAKMIATKRKMGIIDPKTKNVDFLSNIKIGMKFMAHAYGKTAQKQLLTIIKKNGGKATQVAGP